MTKRPPDGANAERSAKHNGLGGQALSLPPLVAGWRVLRDQFRNPVSAVVTLGCIIALPATLLFLSYQGFCFERARFLSHEEYFSAAIQRTVSSRRLVRVRTVPGAVIFEPLKLIPYRDETEFREQNPNCCNIVSHARGPFPSLFERLCGAAAVVVSVTYQANFLDESGRSQSTIETSEYAVSNCGRAWNTRH